MKIAFLGDSVTEGCFELEYNPDGSINIVRDKENCFVTLVTNALRTEYKDIETYNFGSSGDSSLQGKERISEVLEWGPDIVVVCYGLNDVCARPMDEYLANMEIVFKAIKDYGAKGIFLTPNMMNTYVHKNTLGAYTELAKNTAERQNSGDFDIYLDKAKLLGKKYGFEIADAYYYWKKLYEYGIDTTELLSNYINHPTRAMHKLFCDLILDIIVSNEIPPRAK